MNYIWIALLFCMVLMCIIWKLLINNIHIDINKRLCKLALANLLMTLIKMLLYHLKDNAAKTSIIKKLNHMYAS